MSRLRLAMCVPRERSKCRQVSVFNIHDLPSQHHSQTVGCEQERISEWRLQTCGSVWRHLPPQVSDMMTGVRDCYRKFQPKANHMRPMKESLLPLLPELPPMVAVFARHVVSESVLQEVCVSGDHRSETWHKVTVVHRPHNPVTRFSITSVAKRTYNAKRNVFRVWKESSRTTRKLAQSSPPEMAWNSDRKDAPKEPQ